MSRYIISPHPQGSPEWYADRAGKATASKAGCIQAKGRNGGESTTRRNYIAQLVAEILSGKSMDEDGYQSHDMLKGKEREPMARMATEAATGEPVEEVGFASLIDRPIGCSFDGFICDRKGFVEIKCPNLSTHIQYLMANRVPPEYVPQATHEFLVGDCEFMDFVSFNPDLPKPNDLLIVRAYRSEFDIKEYEIAMTTFLSEVDGLTKRLRERQPMKIAA